MGRYDAPVEPAPLDYAPPPTRRRGVFVAGLLAHLIASYAVAVAAVAVRSVVAGPPPVAVVAVVAAAPLWVPLGFIVLIALARTLLLIPAGAVLAYVGLLVLGYRRLRRPRDI
jgi:hypothetical protein